MRKVLFVKRPVVQVALVILVLAVVAVVFTMAQDRAWATSGTVTYNTLPASGAVAETRNTLSASGAVSETYNTLRVYGGSGWPTLRGNVGAGSGVVTDEVGGCVVLVETQPYTDALAIFNPQLPQAPRKDSITWNPLFMSGLETWDENYFEGLYEPHLKASGINASEKVWFRMWYEPEHWDKDDNRNCEFDRDPITGEPTDDDEWYPAIMQEFTYLLMELDWVANKPEPTYGEAGSTSFVFPVGMRYEDLFTDTGAVDTSSDNALYGYGLTSLDGNFDGKPDIVYVESEWSLRDGSPSITIDFNGDVNSDGDVIDHLDPDGEQLSGDELVVFHLGILEFSEGGCVQFLDHMACLEGVSHGQVTLRMWRIGNRKPMGGGTRTVNVGDATLVDDAWFAYLHSVNAGKGTADLMVGRALGATHSAVESASSHLKRFYVDGHEYNVVAIKTHSKTEFKFITIRTPIPKTEDPYYINQHSVFLQNYLPEEPLSVMPPYNYEHYIIEDVQAITAFDIDEDDVDYFGKLVGPVPPILQKNDPFSYEGVYPPDPEHPVGPYGDPRELYLRYVDEGPNPQFLGELKQKYGEELVAEEEVEFWYVEQWWTRPWEYTEFVLPDIRDDITEAESAWDPNGAEPDPDLYLLTSAFTAPQAEYLYWIQDDSTPLRYNLSSSWEHDEEEDTITGVLDGWEPRVKFWFDPAVGGQKYKALGRLRLYGRGNDGGAGDTSVVTDTVSTGPGTAAVEVPPYTDPWDPFNPQLPQAPRQDSLTFNPALMDMESSGDPLSPLYDQLLIEDDDAQEKVFFRMWYQPEYLDTVLKAEIVGDIITATDVITFPALLQEFTYMFLDYDGQPSHAQPGEPAQPGNPSGVRSRFAFPMGTASDQLPAPDPDDGELSAPPDGPPSFGYGLTTFDADFDGSPDAVSIHSERTLSEITGIQADFDGDNDILDQLDTDGVELSGDELVIFAVESIVLEQYNSAMFLDHMVTLEDVTCNPNQPCYAKFQFWDTGGGIYAYDGGYSLHPIPEPGLYNYTTLEQGEMAVVRRNHTPRVISAGGDNLGDTDGAWFVYIHGLDALGTKSATLTIGRALGATHSAMFDGTGHRHDLTPGDPWYLKRFFVDGHEYNVVAIKTVLNDEAVLDTEPMPPGFEPIECGGVGYFVPGSEECWEFKYITIRTPVPKVNKINIKDSIKLEGYHQGTVFGVNTNIISVMPPFNYRHTRVHDIQKLEETAEPEGETEEEIVFANEEFYYDNCMGDWEGNVDPLEIEIKRQCIEMQFFGELKEKFWEEEEEQLWATEQFHTQPHLCTELELPAGQLYLLTSDWESDQSWVHYYGCDPDDGYFTQNDLNEWNPDIPATNTASSLLPDLEDFFIASVDKPLRVKFWYDPEDPDGLYVGTWGMTPTCTADAGPDKEICEGGSVVIGGDPTCSSGALPCDCSWSPDTGLDDPNECNPTASPNSTTTYTVTVTDDNECTETDSMTLTVNPKPTADAGPDKQIDAGGSVEIGGEPTCSSEALPCTCSWSPETGLSDPDECNPIASPTSTAFYSVTCTDSKGCTDSDIVKVTVTPDGEEYQGYLNPQHSSASYDNTTDVQILVNATGFKSGQIKLTYVYTCAEVTDWVPHTADFQVQWQSSLGQEWITFYAEEPMTGTHLIGTLTIHCESDDPCTTALNFVEEGEDGPWTTKLFDEGGHEISGTWQDGTFACGEAVCGDVNCSGEVNMGDVGVLHTYVSHKGDYPLCCEWCGDVTCPNEPEIIIGMGDVGLLHTYVTHQGDWALCCYEGAQATAAPAPAVPAAAENEVYLVPQDSSAPFCETADVEIQVDATGFKTGQIKLAYYSTCADVEGWEPNLDDFLEITWNSDTSGEEWITFLAEDAITGTYRIGTLTIHAVYEKGCHTILDFVEEEDGPWTSKLFDELGNEISATWTDGTFASPRYKVYLPLVMKNFQ